METSIRQRRFKVWYQPVFNLKTNRFSSAEALLRLRDYDGEPVSPSEFIPLAEETGLIDDLSWIVAGGGLHASWTDAGQNRFYIHQPFHAAVRGPQTLCENP
ncbi:MAG: EAL domain-containing protein [Enterocloster bolteae]